MFLSNTLALFRPPVHLHVQVAPHASSSPTHNQPHHPSIHVSYFTSSFTSTPAPEQTHAAGADAATNKQLVPKVISRCSPTKTIPTKINPTSPTLSPSRAQIRPRTKAQEGHEVRPYQWNPIFFPKPPTPPTMLKDDSTRRKAAAITPPTKTPTKKSVLSYLHSPAGHKFLDNLERETLLKRKSSQPNFGPDPSSPSTIAGDDRAQHDISLEYKRKSRGAGVDGKFLNGSTSSPECQSVRNREYARDTSVRHVATSAWSEDACSQSPASHLTGADAGSLKSSRVTRDSAGADVFDDEDLTEDIPIRSKLSYKDQLNLKESFDQILRGITQDSKTNEMGLGRLEFGYPFRLPPGGTKHPVKKEPPTKPAAVQAPGRVLPTVSSHGIVPQPLPPRSQVVLITDADQDPTDVDQRGLPSGSSVVLVIDQQYDVRFHDPRSVGKSPETVGTPSKSRRRNPLRDTVRLRWSVFHPEYTEKSEFVFQPSQLSSRPEPKRKLSVTIIEQRSKRTRDDDIEGPIFNEKPTAIAEHHIAEPAAESGVGPVAVEEPISVEQDSEPIQQLPSPPSELESDPEDGGVEIEETEVAITEPLQQQPSPPPSPATSPIPLKFKPEEEAEIKKAIKEAIGDGIPSQSEVETEVEAEADPDVDSFAIDLSTLPPLPESKPASPAIEPVQVEDDVDTVEIDLATLPALPDSPVVEAVDAEEQEETVPVSLQLDDKIEDDKPQADTIPPRQMIQQPSPPPSEPGTPVMGSEKDGMKVVPWMPLTPPETPLSMRHGRERVIEFNMTIPLYMQPPSTPSSILDSPSYFRGKDRQTEDAPTHYFIPAPPSPSSPSHSILDSPLASRMRRIGETIKEEEEEEEVEVEVSAVVVNEDDDVEEIVRSHISYPSPPSSPMPSILDSPASKGKELSRVPSFTIIYSPSPPPSIRDIPTLDEDVKSAPSPPASEIPVSSKGKERETLEKTLPSPVLEQEEYEQDEEEGLNQRSTTYPLGWATADDIFTNPDSYQYTYQYNSRPPTPASSIGSLSRRWSGISRMSYNTAITTPPATRPGSAVGNHKLISWSDNDHLLRRTDSFASSIRRELFRDQPTSRARKPLLVAAETSSDKKRPALRWSVSMPLIREQWTIRYPLVMSPADKGFVGAKDDDTEEYDVHIPGSIQLLPLTRGVIVTPPRIERRRRQRTTSSNGPHRRKVRSLVVYSPDDQLEGIGQLFGDLHELSDVEDELVAAQRIVEVVETVGEEQDVAKEVVAETVKEQEEVVEVLKKKKKSVLKRLKTRASLLKEKVKVKVHSSKKAKNGVAV